MTFRFLPVVETIFIDHTSTTENRLQKPAYDASQSSPCFTLADKNCYAILQKLLSNVEKDLFQTLKKHFSNIEKIFLKRWKTLLPNV